MINNKLTKYGYLAAHESILPYRNVYERMGEIVGFKSGISNNRKSQLTKKQKAKRNKTKAARKARRR